MASNEPVGSPVWWLRRLHRRLTDRRPRLEALEHWYSGEHPLPFLHEKARSPFRRLLAMSRSNYLRLVVDAAAGRLQVDGFRTPGPDPTGDEAAWGIWQANGLDAESDLLFTEALKLGAAYVLVEPARDGDEHPRVTVEHPAQVVTENVPGSRREVAAGLKCWRDDHTAAVMATLFLPEEVRTYSAPDKMAGEPAWTNVDGLSGPNPLGVVPVVEFANRPSLLTDPASELDGVTDIQARINKTLADRLMAQEYGAFKQRWVTGMDIPRDENGLETEPFDIAVNRILIAEDSDTRFGEFAATDLKPYLESVRDDIRDIAAITSTPPHYLLGDMVNLSAEALKAAEAGLISKVRNRMRHYGESIEQVMRLALQASGDPRGADDASEVVWRNPEFRTEGELVDALVKMHSLGVPQEALWERWGASPQEIARWQAMRDQAAERVTAFDTAALEGPKPEPGQEEDEATGEAPGSRQVFTGSDDGA